MSSIIQGYNYDIFISYRKKDNKHDGWVTEFVNNLKGELESTFKEEISVYFDINPHDGLLETHDVDASLKEKLKCLIFIPIISRTYCDPKSFAWEHEFKAFVEMASKDRFGLKVKLPNGNVAGRVLPVRIHDLDQPDIKECELVIGSILRGIEFIYREPGVNKPLPKNDPKYPIQVNKVANAIWELISAMKEHGQQPFEKNARIVESVTIKRAKTNLFKIIIPVLILLIIVIFVLKITRIKGDISIAVLPFRNESPDSINRYFVDGIKDQIQSNLEIINGLQIIGGVSVQQYRNTNKTIPRIAKELNVNYIIDGSGQKFGKSSQVTVRLIKAKNEEYIWGHTYPNELNGAEDILKIESQISEAIADELKVVISRKENQLINKIPTRSMEAWEAYLMGQVFIRSNNKNGLDSALKYFEKSKTEDPEFALAYVGISNVWLNREIWGHEKKEIATPRALAAINKSLELDDECAEAFLTLASIKFILDWDKSEAIKNIKKALELKPNFADAYSVYSEILHGKTALKYSEKAFRLDPYNESKKGGYGVALLNSGRFDDAIKIFREVLGINPLNGLALGNLPSALHLSGQYDIKSWQNYCETNFTGFEHAFRNPEKKDYKSTLLAEADTLAAQMDSININPWEIAVLYAFADNQTRAIDMLEESYRRHDPNMLFLSYPAFKVLKDEPRFKELCRKLNYKPKFYR
jgi:TolB-like protein